MDVNANKKPSALAGFWKKRNAAHPSAALLGDLAAAAAVFLLARTHLLFGAYPLGIACLAALRGWTALAGLLGGLLAALGMGSIGYIYGALMIAVTVMRFITSFPGKGRRILPDSEGVFKELPQLRSAVACIAGFSAALYQLLVAGPTTATLLFGAAMLIAPTVGTLLFSGIFDASLTVEELLGKSQDASVYRDSGDSLRLSVGALSLGFFLVVSLGGISLFGLSVAYLFAAAATLYVSKRYGALRASAFGLLITLGASPLYAPSFALLGLLSGALWELGAFYALSLGVAAGAVWSSYVGQLSGFLSVAPELVLVSIVIWPLLGSLGTPAEMNREQTRSSLGRLAVRGFIEEHENAPGRYVAALESALSSLSETLRGISGSFSEPDSSEYLHAVEGACEKHCSVCPRRMACSGRGAATQTVAARLAAGEQVDTAVLDEIFVRDCGSIGVILADCRAAAAALRSSGGAERTVTAASLDYELLSRLLAEAAERDQSERHENTALGAELHRALSERGVESGAVAVYGERRKSLMVGGADLGGASVSGEELQRTLEAICACRLEPLSYVEKNGTVTIETETARRFATETHRAYRAASSEEVSGDTVSFFENSDGYFYALLSDGMGSGRRAALTSGISAIFLEKLLGAGCSKTAVLKMLNNLLRMGGEESSATVDLLELDLLSGHATFIKSGAAPSYVKRGENLFRIRSKTVSVGLTETLDAEKIRFDAEPGDVIVMLSDGVSQSPEDAPWLMEILSGDLGEDLSAAAERIVGVAAGLRDRRDDMSVALVRVCELGAEKREAPTEEPIAEVVISEENGLESLSAAV